MSDGPYRSLPMRKAWRDVSERAHKDSFSATERADAMRVALHDDFKRDIGKDFLNAVGGILVGQPQRSLLADQAGFELEAIRNRFPSNTLRDAVIEHTQVALQQGLEGEAALEEGVNRAAIDNAYGNNRSVEEWYYRESTSVKEDEKAISVRANLDATLQDPRVKGFGRDIVGLIRGEKVDTKLQKSSGVDAGPVIA